MSLQAGKYPTTHLTVNLYHLELLDKDRIEITAHYCSSIVAVGSCLFVKLLVSNGCFIFAYSAGVA
jgi:hypothetical protein